MINPIRGESQAILDGQPHRLCLTLGALAELEHYFGEDDMLALSERFSRGRLSAKDSIAIIGSALRGAGHDVDNQQVARMKVDGGAVGYVRIISELLHATFGQVDRQRDAGTYAAQSKPLTDEASAKTGSAAEGAADATARLNRRIDPNENP